MCVEPTQKYFLGRYPLPGEKILVIRRPEQLERYARHLTGVQFFGNVWHGLYGKYRSEHIIVLAGGVGSSQVGDAVYALDKPGAVCIFSGTCGGLASGICLGDYLIASEAVDGSGYGLTFGQAPFSKVRAVKTISDNVRQTLSRLQLPNHTGSVFSTGSVVREIDDDFWMYVPKNSSVIEMECAAFLLAAVRSKKEAGAFFWVTDMPNRGKSFFDQLCESDLALKQARYDTMIEVNLKVIANL